MHRPDPYNINSAEVEKLWHRPMSLTFHIRFITNFADSRLITDHIRLPFLSLRLLPFKFRPAFPHILIHNNLISQSSLAVLGYIPNSVGRVIILRHKSEHNLLLKSLSGFRFRTSCPTRFFFFNFKC